MDGLVTHEFFVELADTVTPDFYSFLDLGDFQIVSASPERFLQVRNGEVEARPIKGTRRRDRGGLPPSWWKRA